VRGKAVAGRIAGLTMKTIIALSLSAALVYGQLQTRAVNGAAVSQPRPPSSFDCSADGTVVNAVTGEPIARAHVTVTSAGTAYSASTDSSGAWSLTNVGCAPAQLQVTRAGFLQGGPGNFRQIQFVSGSPVHDLKSQLTPQSVAVGKVLDDQGDPVQGVQVTAFIARVVEGHAHFQAGGVNLTNDLGEYRVANLQRGKYIFCTHANRPAASVDRTITADSCYPGPLDGGSASAMDLPAGRETKIDFNLNQVTPVHIRGTVTGMPEGRGIGVNLVRREANADTNTNVSGTVRDGQFDFRVTPGPYMLTADYFEAGKRLSARVPVNAGGSDIDNVVVNLEQGFTVTGVVRVISQSGASAGQFQLSLRSSEPSIAGGPAKWNADHTAFTINDMAPGVFRVQSNPPAPFYIKSATLAGQDILNNDIPISQSAGPIELTLRDDGGSLDADVVDAAGQPVAATVMLLRGTTRVASFPAGSNGHFKLQNIAPGDYMIYAWDDANLVQYAEPDWMRRNAAGGVSVTIASGQNAQVKLVEQIVPVQ
jgi:hypothetical protein